MKNWSRFRSASSRNAVPGRILPLLPQLFEGLAGNLPGIHFIINFCHHFTYPTSDVDLPKLHHIVFTNNFHSVQILDNRLKLVPSGEFALLASI
jgi:hypothetical protein